MEYEIVIGIEVHSELSTKSKIFCSCSTEFGNDENSNVCPICLGMPGTLPVLNKTAVEYAVKAGIATNCKINGFSKQDRKNYFYPDLPKNYQVSQFDLPLCENGFVEIVSEGSHKKIGITRIHIEEDAGKLIHSDYDDGSLVDYNRCGVPLIEIVSEPDIRSASEAKSYLESLKMILEYLEVSDCKMQEGSLRADINLSIRPKGQKEFGTRTEMKNLNSFKAIVRAIEFEAKRQIEEIEDGNKIIQETRRWDDDKGKSYPMRSKENAHDYRYFPEPDLVPIVIDDAWLSSIKSSIPELPKNRIEKYINSYQISEADALILVSNKKISDFFELASKNSNNPKSICNFITGDMLRYLKEKDSEDIIIPFEPTYLTTLVSLIDEGKISSTIGKKVFEKMFREGREPQEIIEKEGLFVVSDEGFIVKIVKEVLENNPQSVADFKNGKEKAIAFLVGQVMRQSKGKADPQIVNKLIKDELSIL